MYVSEEVKVEMGLCMFCFVCLFDYCLVYLQDNLGLQQWKLELSSTVFGRQDQHPIQTVSLALGLLHTLHFQSDNI